MTAADADFSRPLECDDNDICVAAELRGVGSEIFPTALWKFCAVEMCVMCEVVPHAHMHWGITSLIDCLMLTCTQASHA